MVICLKRGALDVVEACTTADRLAMASVDVRRADGKLVKT